MNMMITSRLLQAVCVKATNPLNRIRIHSVIKFSSVNNASNEMILAVCACRTSLTCNTGIIREYKNFGHKDPDPKYPPGSGIAKFIFFYRIYLAVFPMGLLLNWDYILWYFKPDLHEKWHHKEDDLEVLYPHRPSSGM